MPGLSFVQKPFLSENPEFVKACEDNGIVFIGPTKEIMNAMGDKISSKKEAPAASPAPSAPAAAPAAPAAEEEEFSSGTLKLKGCDEKTAAMIMAIVSDNTGIPLSELVFKSITLVENK